jgi:Carboxypeptidase regulatory-like domain/Ankyrin repeats (3 copies)/Ankyrin repeats (many copies)
MPRDLSEQLKIKTPCSANWDQMIGNEWVRFCEHCQLTVNDLTPLTPKRVRRLIENSKGRLCVRYRVSREGTPLLKAVPQQLHQIRKRVSKIAASAFTATLTISAAASPASNHGVGRPHTALQHAAAMLAPRAFGATIKGTVRDSMGGLIPAAGLTLGTDQIPYMYGTTTNGEGEYSFDGLEPGSYQLSVEAPGFKKATIGVQVVANEAKEVSATLEIAPIEVEMEVTASDIEEVTVGGEVVVLPAHPMIQAAFDDDLEEIQALLTRDNVNTRDERTERTALEYAALNGNREMLQLLLAAGAEVNTRNSYKQTPLMLLGEEATADMVWDLVHAGAKVDLKDEEGDTALTEAAANKNLPVLMALINAGARVDTKNKEGKTALMMAADNGQVANIRALVRAGADINARDKEGKTALDYANSAGSETAIKLLQSFGAITGEPDEN